MKTLIVTNKYNGKKLCNFILTSFPNLSQNTLYKALRQKDIKINGKRVNKDCIIFENDELNIFIADSLLFPQINLDIVYEDDNVLIINKQSGMLSQKAEASDVSVNEYIISYLVSTNKLSEEQLKTFKPGVCNRLDRNTSGLIIAGKSLKGLQTMSKMFKERTMDKYYFALVNGKKIK